MGFHATNSWPVIDRRAASRQSARQRADRLEYRDDHSGTICLCWQLSESGHRFYWPELGRWLSRDPIGEKAFWSYSTRQMSRAERERWDDDAVLSSYVVVENTPVVAIDELGLRMHLLIDSSCGQTPGILSSFQRARDLVMENAESAPIELGPAIACLRSPRNMDRQIDVECGGCICWIGNMQGWTAGNVVHLCPGNPGRLEWGTVVLVEATKAYCGVTVATEYIFARWIQTLLGAFGI